MKQTTVPLTLLRPLILLLALIALIPFKLMAAADNRAGTAWGANYFPNIPLTTHEGKQVKFFDDVIKGKVVAINFIFTSCPDVCPLETSRLKNVQQILGDRVGKDVFMYSITIDPERDTPEVLKQYAEKFGVGPGWYFLTGKESDITLLRQKLGLYIDEIQGEDSTDHNLSLIIGNQTTGRWMKRSPFENPYILANEIGSWLHNWKLPAQEKRDYAKAPELRTITVGESLFRTRCASCHTIGAHAKSGSPMDAVGPDLLGVTRNRDREWLTRWLSEPDKMLAEKDPIAVALLKKYKVPMPNLSLNQLEINALLEYIEEESKIIQTTRQDHSTHQPHSGKHH